ncbi:hypothetical protein JW916_16835 [Candidatus Sumerlaeota bacterium]|nr:hypothetical protein [Candidatus Sumerlaeota bacterium]
MTKDVETSGTKSYGRIYSTRVPMAYVRVSPPEGSVESEKLIVDWNANRDLTDDTPIELEPLQESQVVEITTADGVAHRALLRCEAGSMAMFQPAEWYRGKIDLDGKRIEAALIDTDFGGLDLERQDLLVLDLNGDGSLSPMLGAGERCEAFYLRDTVFFGGDLYGVSLDESRTSVSIASYAGDTGFLAVDVRLGAGAGAGAPTMSGYVYTGRGMPLYLSNVSSAKPVRLPVGAYRSVSLNLSPWMLQVQAARRRVGVRKDETTSLVVDAPATLTVTIARQGLNLSVGRQCLSQSGDVEYVQFSNSPRVEIFSTADGAKLGGGEMEYG